MVIGIDIGGTKVRVGRAAHGVQPNRTVRFATPANYNQALALMLQAISNLSGGRPVKAVGLASPAPLNPTTGVIMNPQNLPWHNVSICQDLSAKLGCPVLLGHDATLAAVAEARYGAGRSYGSVTYVTISTGIGSGLVIAGSPVYSAYNLEGGKQLITHDAQTRQPLSFEQVASGRAIAERYGKIAADIHDRRSWDEISYYFALGLHNLICIQQPEVVVLGGGVAVHYQRFIKPLLRHVNQLQVTYPLPKLTQARFVETAPLIGAFMIARDAL